MRTGRTETRVLRAALPLPADLTRDIVSMMGEQMVAWVMLAAAPILLIVGSLLPGI